jgi:excisionase family DNA binding protein
MEETMETTNERQALPALLTVEETAKALRVGRTLTWALVRRGEIKSIRLGRRVFVPCREVDRLLRGEVM